MMTVLGSKQKSIRLNALSLTVASSGREQNQGSL